MSRNICLSALNLVTHPHSSQSYKSIFSAALKLRQPIRIRGIRYGILKSAFQNGKEENSLIYGEIYTFTRIGPSDWFHFEEGEPLTEEEAEQIQIPEGVVPHLKRIGYVFIPEKHLFVFVTTDNVLGSISESMMRDYISELFNDNRIVQSADYASVDVNLVQSTASLDRIFSLKIEKLKIELNRPNDTGDDIEKTIEEEMEEQNIGRSKLELTAKKGNSITPNTRTKKLMRAALTNGRVQARGLDEEDDKRSEDTAESPVRENYQYDAHSEQTYFDFLIESARKLCRVIYPNHR
ncbi:MAG: DUF4747 family protein [Verrucomicrobiota bacterium JB022]|nr:DUF4747 family protein [Verrucomicrobiota bacterium JB022]